MTKVFVEQPLASAGSANYLIMYWLNFANNISIFGIIAFIFVSLRAIYIYITTGIQYFNGNKIRTEKEQLIVGNITLGF